MAFKCTKSTKLIEFHFRFLHPTLATNTLLFKMDTQGMQVALFLVRNLWNNLVSFLQRLNVLPKTYYLKGGGGGGGVEGRLLTTILLLWEVPNHHIFETLTSADKLLRYVCSMGKAFKIYESQPYWAGHVNRTEKSLKLKRHTVLVIENSASI